MALETVLVWLVVGLISGWLVSIVGGGRGFLGDIVIGISAFIGQLQFRRGSSWA